MDLKEAMRMLNYSQSQMRLGNLPDYSQNVYQSIEKVLQELDNLQKENEETKNIDLTTVYIKAVCDEKERWRNKIREKIEELEENLKDFEQTDNTGRFSREKSRDYDKKEVLENLLKEE